MVNEFKLLIRVLFDSGFLQIIEWTHKRKNSHYISMIR
ncbi:hypothetical protein D1AOALGA4SA_1991 [Olavius algarvensis Delta 1 endosymbiont]|nr:hypothetical protein D1AOALGA4SA_1991 [Olavius algarvensis Delta 1 endosymbiont]